MIYNIRLYLKSFNIFLLNKLVFKLKENFSKLGLKFSGAISLPNKIEKFNILRSPHVNKKHRDQLQIITYKKFIDYFNVNKKEILKINDFLFFISLDWRIKILK